MVAQDLLQIVYFSRARPDLADADVADIHRVAIRRNTAEGITGLLLFDGARFIQAIEGASADIRATMGRITADPRHDAIQIAADHPIEHRQFGDWAMTYRRTPPGTCSREFLAQVREDVRVVTDPNLQAVFIGFAYLAWR